MHKGYITFFLNKKKMQEDNVSIYFAAYGIAISLFNMRNEKKIYDIFF